MEMVRICSTWDIFLGLSLKESRGGATIKYTTYDETK